MNIRMEDCDEETITRIVDKSIPHIKTGTLTPEIAATIIEDEYIRQMIRDKKLLAQEETE